MKPRVFPASFKTFQASNIHFEEKRRDVLLKKKIFRDNFSD